MLGSGRIGGNRAACGRRLSPSLGRTNVRLRASFIQHTGCSAPLNRAMTSTKSCCALYPCSNSCFSGSLHPHILQAAASRPACSGVRSCRSSRRRTAPGGDRQSLLRWASSESPPSIEFFAARSQHSPTASFREPLSVFLDVRPRLPTRNLPA
jgi:hypothetical protein